MERYADYGALKKEAAESAIPEWVREMDQEEAEARRRDTRPEQIASADATA